MGEMVHVFQEPIDGSEALFWLGEYCFVPDYRCAAACLRSSRLQAGWSG